MYIQQVWEFDLDHQRWLPVAELSLPDDQGDEVYAVSWAPNIGRYHRNYSTFPSSIRKLSLYDKKWR